MKEYCFLDKVNLLFDDEFEYINVSHINRQECLYLPRLFIVESSSPPIIKGKDSWYKSQDVIATIMEYQPFKSMVSSIIIKQIAQYISYGEMEKGLLKKIEKTAKRSRWRKSDFITKKGKCLENVVHTYIAINSSNNVKIGRTRNIGYRLSQLRTSDPSLFMLCFVNEDIEKELHCEYKNKRIDSSREFFKFSQEELQQLIFKYNFINY